MPQYSNIGFDIGGGEYIVPDKSLSKTSNPKVHIAKFGDGYEQRLRKGINNREEQFEVSFENRTISEINKITEFLDPILGVTAFDFTIPSSSSNNLISIKVVATTYNRTYNYNNFNSLTATFRRVYEL